MRAVLTILVLLSAPFALIAVITLAGSFEGLLVTSARWKLRNLGLPLSYFLVWAPIAAFTTYLWLSWTDPRPTRGIVRNLQNAATVASLLILGLTFLAALAFTYIALSWGAA